MKDFISITFDGYGENKFKVSEETYRYIYFQGYRRYDKLNEIVEELGRDEIWRETTCNQSIIQVDY